MTHTQSPYMAPSNDVVAAGKPRVSNWYTGTSTIKPGMTVVVADAGTNTITIGTATGASLNALRVAGIALYKESAPESQRNAVGSTYAKGVWIAVADGGDAVINAHVYGTTYVGQPLHLCAAAAGIGRLAGFVAQAGSTTAIHTLTAGIVARALVPFAGGASGTAVGQTRISLRM